MIKIKDSSSGVYLPLDENKITIYNCGPTVYNDVHIGNLRPVITMDVLYRYLKAIKHDVFYVHNITDIDDKIINKSIETKQEELKLSDHYFHEYLKILDQLNILKMDVLPKVSDNIDGIIEFIKKLVENKRAYVVDGDVYFDVSQNNNYGVISGQKTENLLKGVRKEIDDKKHNPLDFVLWKKTDKGINWVTEWNDCGRPGWHTECVYLINKFIGKNVVIHGGGVDLKFPHHENENAQNLAMNNLPLAKIWMHVGHINVNNEKMSKSLNNFVLAKDILKEFDANTIRWFFYQTKYQAPLNYSIEVMNSAKKDISKIIKTMNYALINLYWLKREYVSKNDELPNEVIEALNDDLNLPNVVTYIYQIVKQLSQLINKKDGQGIQNNLNNLLSIFNVLGLTYTNPLTNNKEVIKVIKKWKLAMDNKDYNLSDLIRSELKKEEII